MNSADNNQKQTKDLTDLSFNTQTGCHQNLCIVNPATFPFAYF